MPVLTRQFTATPDVVERFWRFVSRGDAGTCWEWTGSRDRDGRGRFAVKRRPHNAPRVAWVIANGPIPDGVYVLHRCDNPACVNVEHLFLGTHQDNMDDRTAKGRWRGYAFKCGERNHKSKLTDAQFASIIERRAAGEKVRALAREHGIAHSALWRRLRDVATTPASAPTSLPPQDHCHARP